MCTVLGGGLSLVAAAGPATSAGALPSALTVTPTAINFGEVTLGDVVGDQFTLTNTSTTQSDTVTDLEATGTGANDFFGLVDPACDIADNGDITLGPSDTCIVFAFFNPGTLGPRNATIVVTDSLNSGATVALSGVGGIGYYQVSSRGAVANFGDAGFFGDLSGQPLNKPIVGIAQTGDDGGYWLVASDGGLFNYGDAGFFGSAGGIHLNKPIVGIAPTSDGGGYWMVATDGGIFNYGDAPFYGSTGSITLNKAIVGMAATPDGGGYWLVASDGGIFSYGDAQFYGSTGSITLNKPIVGMAATPDGGGYWLVASDGGIFAFGDAQFFGSTGSIHLAQPIVGMAAMPDGGGYWFTAADGGLFNYGTAPFQGSSAGTGLGSVVGMATDGAPTLQAFLDFSGQRAHTSESVPLLRPLPAGARHFAGG
ncbi:MAG TPA: hypothetical protein VH012_00030 [Acidimicrobiales bacterium]|nr:hypothetical protein [Acidimicrobiales bacterium]